MLNLSSKILINMLAGDIENFFKTLYKDPVIAVSPIMNHERVFFDYTLMSNLLISNQLTSYYISFYTNDINSDAIKPVKEHIVSNLYNIKIILSNLFKKNYNVEAIDSKNGDDNWGTSRNLNRIDISIKTKEKEHYFSLLIPLEFFKLFSDTIENSQDTDLIDNEVKDFFSNPRRFFPSLKTILETFSSVELQNLFYQLQKKNLLTTYQICLIVRAFPHYSVRIKNNLSTNTIKDVQAMMRSYEAMKSLNKKDLIEGVYSVEEAIFMLMKNDDDFSFSRFLLETQKRIKLFSNTKLLLLNDFSHWIDKINKSGLLYQTIAITNEIDIAKSISDKPETYYSILTKHISEKKIKDILTLIEDKRISYTEQLESQIQFISNYRKIRMKRSNYDHESFKLLISRIYKHDEANHLLFGVGWFILSTALKNVNRKRVMQLIEGMPIGAKYLIIDVLQGVVNPNILHDEIQIKKARSFCVKEIISLYEDGFILLK